jgi:hypothetical protein
LVLGTAESICDLRQGHCRLASQPTAEKWIELPRQWRRRRRRTFELALLVLCPRRLVKLVQLLVLYWIKNENFLDQTIALQKNFSISPFLKGIDEIAMSFFFQSLLCFFFVWVVVVKKLQHTYLVV